MTAREATTLLVLRSIVMFTIAIFFLCVPFVVPKPNGIGWIGMAIVMSPGVMILYVEFWLWHRRCCGAADDDRSSTPVAKNFDPDDAPNRNDIG